VPDRDDQRFTWRLNHELNTLVLPGSYLGRGGDASGGGRPNPGAGFVRVALVEDLESCVEGARRICSLIAAVD
jgi:N-succinyldiaminopimelate aminotransferase